MLYRLFDRTSTSAIRKWSAFQQPSMEISLETAQIPLTRYVRLAPSFTERCQGSELSSDPVFHKSSLLQPTVLAANELIPSPETTV